MGDCEVIKHENQVRCYFVITGFDEAPDFFTKLLGINPSDSGKKGDLRQSHIKHKSYLVKENFWRLDSDLSDSHNIADYVENLINKLRPMKSEAKHFFNNTPLNVESNIIVAITIYPNLSLPGMILKPDLMLFMSSHAINLVIDMN